MTSNQEVLITGWGATSPFGAAAATADALVEGRSSLEKLPDELIGKLDRGADLDALRARRAARVDFNPREAFAGRNFRPVDRTGQLAILAAEEALSEAGWVDSTAEDPGSERPGQARPGHSVGLVLGTMFGSVHTISAFDRRGLEAGPKYVKPLDFANSVINAAAGQTAIWLGLTGTNSTITGGHAAGVLALAQATQLIRDGRAEALLAGGAEELSYEALVGYEQAGLLSEASAVRAFDVARDGTLLGEGAALLMIESEASAGSRGAAPIARVLGHGNAFDISRGRDPGRAARAQERSIRQALDDAGIDASEIGAAVTSACGLPQDHSEGQALVSVLGNRIPVTAISPSLGCCLGAGGAFQALTLVHAFDSGRLPAIRGLEKPDTDLALDFCREAREVDIAYGLVTASSLDGVAAALVLGGAESTS